MWKKIVDRVRRKAEKKAPQWELRAELLSLHADTGEKAELVKQALGEQTMGQLAILVEELWEQLQIPAKQSILQVLQEQGKIPGLITDLTGTNKQKNATAAILIGKLQIEEAIPQLIQLLASSDLSVVLAAAEALRGYQLQQTLPQLLATLANPKRWPPARVAEVLVSYGPEVTLDLVKAYWVEKGQSRLFIMEMLGQLGTQAGIPAICEAMAAPEPELRQKGVFAAGRIGGPLVAKPVQDLLRDTVPAVRAEALESLARIAPEQIIPVARAAILDPDRLVRSRAAGVLAEHADLPANIWAVIGKREISTEENQLLQTWLAEVGAVGEVAEVAELAEVAAGKEQRRK